MKVTSLFSFGLTFLIAFAIWALASTGITGNTITGSMINSEKAEGHSTEVVYSENKNSQKNDSVDFEIK